MMSKLITGKIRIQGSFDNTDVLTMGRHLQRVLICYVGLPVGDMHGDEGVAIALERGGHWHHDGLATLPRDVLRSRGDPGDDGAASDGDSSVEVIVGTQETGIQLQGPRGLPMVATLGRDATWGGAPEVAAEAVPCRPAVQAGLWRGWRPHLGWRLSIAASEGGYRNDRHEVSEPVHCTLLSNVIRCMSDSDICSMVPAILHGAHLVCRYAAAP